MNNISDKFSFPRFWEVMKKYVVENWRLLVMGTAMIFGVMIISGVLTAMLSSDCYDGWGVKNPRVVAGIVIDPVWRVVSTIIGTMLFIWGGICASLTGSGLGSKEKRLSSIMLPASQLEKYIVRWLIYIPGFLVVFVAAVVVGELVRVGVTSYLVEDTRMLSVISFDYMMKDLLTGEINFNAMVWILIFFVVQAAFSLGSFLWTKVPVVKTFVAGSLIVLLFVFTILFVLDLTVKPDYQPYQPEESTVQAIFYVSSAVITLFCYVLSYFRMKEMEVINRW